jgi:NADH-quinone oxidoreductase subunit E
MVISEATRGRIREEMARFPAERGALLSALRWVQSEHGHIPPEVAGEVAELFGIRPIEVLEVVSFYTMLHATPQPRHHVAVCTNLSCSLRGARDLLRNLESHLGVGAGEATADGRIRLVHEECLGACAAAPMMRVDGRYHEGLDAEAARRIVDALE